MYAVEGDRWRRRKPSVMRRAPKASSVAPFLMGAMQSLGWGSRETSLNTMEARSCAARIGPAYVVQRSGCERRAF